MFQGLDVFWATKPPSRLEVISEFLGVSTDICEGPSWHYVKQKDDAIFHLISKSMKNSFTNSL